MAAAHEVQLRRVPLSAASWAIVAMVGCSASGRPSGTQPTSAELTAAGSPELRTVDNAGYVDPGGRTRQVSAGTGPSPVDRGGNGTAPRQRERPSTGESAAPAPRPSGPSPAPADASELIERAARALCDRETYCGQIGAGRAFESADACIAEKRDRVHRALDEAACTDEIRGDRVAACLSAIRKAACGPPGVTLQPPAACTAHALCGP